MPIAIFSGERSIAAIADSLFDRLTPRQRDKAEAAILRANPQLRDLRAVPDGALLRVPDLPELRAKASRNRADPEADIAETLADTLRSFGQRFADRVKVAQRATKAQSALLKGARFKRAIADAPHLQELAAEAAKALNARTQGFGGRQKSVKEAVSQALKDLKTRS